jgi:hypothetical protein
VDLFSRAEIAFSVAGWIANAVLKDGNPRATRPKMEGTFIMAEESGHSCTNTIGQ